MVHDLHDSHLPKLARDGSLWNASSSEVLRGQEEDEGVLWVGPHRIVWTFTYRDPRLINTEVRIKIFLGLPSKNFLDILINYCKNNLPLTVPVYTRR